MEKNLSDMAADNALGRKLQDFASAMTLLGYTDGASSHDGVCYLELAGFIIQKGVNVNQDLEELFRRIVFFICVSNTDDHLRNNGFLLTGAGWTLSPAYDIKMTGLNLIWDIICKLLL
jgi:serine/threonine-protein kinase HipA